MRALLLLLLLWPLAALAQADDTAFLDAPANPLTIAVIADDAGAVSALIGPKGGQIAAQTVRGEALLLTIPPGALLREAEITLTPIAETAGLPGYVPGMVGGMMAPEGLEFITPATLEITPLQPLALGDRLHWGFRGRGEETMLHLPDPTAKGIVIPLDHFSGAGVSIAAKIDLQLDRWRQSRLEDRLSTEVAVLIAKWAKSEPDAGAAVVKALAEGKARIVATRRAIASRAASTCADHMNSITAINAVERQSQLLGAEINSETAAVIAHLIETGYSVCLQEELEVCLATGDLSVLVKFITRYERMRQLLAYVSPDAPFLGPEKTAAAKAAIERCGRYKLKVQARGHWEDSAGVYGDVDFKVEVPIRVQFHGDGVLTFDLVGEAPATDVNLTFVDYACWKLDRARVGAPMQAKLSELIFDDAHTPKRATLVMRGPELFAVTSCDGRWGKKTIESPVSESTWGIAHSGNRKGKFYELKTMKAGAHPRIFSTSWEGRGTAQGTTSTDTTALTLEHLGG